MTTATGAVTLCSAKNKKMAWTKAARAAPGASGTPLLPQPNPDRNLTSLTTLAHHTPLYAVSPQLALQEPGVKYDLP